MSDRTYATVCSGINAPGVAVNALGWRAVFHAEIEPFPSAVLAHHEPGVQNLGDMTKIDGKKWRDLVDALIAGTPCQSYSVAGKRESLADDRGQLTLRFVELVHGIDPIVVIWENVPGVLSVEDNAFGCFLAGLVGHPSPLVSSNGTWPNAGMVVGPRRSAAWRILDAQYYRLAQRRRRVYVVSFRTRDGANPGAVLFEPESLPRHSPPIREAGARVAGTIAARTTGGGGLGTDFDTDGGLVSGTLNANGKAAGSATQQDAEAGMLVPIFGGNHGKDGKYALPNLLPRCNQRGTGGPGDGAVSGMPRALAYGGGNQSGAIDVAATINAGGTNRLDFDSENFIAHCLRADGFDANEDGTGQGTPIVPVSFNWQGTGTQTSLGFDPDADTTGTIQANQTPAVAYQCQGSNVGPMGTLRAGNGNETGGVPFVALPFDTTQVTSAANRSDPKEGDPCHPLASGAHAPAIAFQTRIARNGRGQPEEICPTLQGAGAGATSDMRPCMAQQSGTRWSVRRLLPEECEKLQGFPPGYTAIPFRGNPAADGPRYRALGNSMATNVMRWICERVEKVLEARKAVAHA